MPISIGKTSGGLAHAPVFVGQITGTDAVKVDISALTTNEVDSKGYLKPGVPFAKTGLLVANTTTPIWGVTIEAIKIAAGNDSTSLNAATDCFVAVGFGLINRDVAEDVLGRAYSTNEIACFDVAGSNCRITRT